MIIAIDGHAGLGKSTIAKLLARYYNAVFMNTGSFYRALTLSLLEHAKKMQVPLDSLDDEFIIEKAKDLKCGVLHLCFMRCSNKVSFI